jgi:alpha-methylacyl-CoA racemase
MTQPNPNQKPSLPLQGITVLEFAGLAPAPFCGMVLSDFGANVIRIDRVAEGKLAQILPDRLARGKRSIALDFKSPHGREVVLQMVKKADVIIEPFRPSVMERAGGGFSLNCFVFSPLHLFIANQGMRLKIQHDKQEN